MNDEIKEILDKLKDREETYQFCKQYKLAVNDWIYEAHYLLDYISNLQERCAYLERSNNRREDTIIGLRFEVAEQEDYKSRCEKAVEYINTHDDSFYQEKGLNEDSLNNLLNILQNGSEDNEC